MSSSAEPCRLHIPMGTAVAIACAGLHAGVLVETLELNGVTDISLFDDFVARGTCRFGREIVGKLEDLDSWYREGRISSALIGTANVRALDLRRRAFDQLQSFGIPLARAIHPRAFVSPSAMVGEGTFIGPMVTVHSRATIGRNVCVYSGSVIEHDNIVEDHVFIAPGVITTGASTIESGAYLGPGVTIGSGRRVGHDSIIGARAVVLSDVAPHSVAFGVPARVVKSVEEWRASQE